MNRAELFRKHSTLAQRDGEYVMTKIQKMMVWKDNCNVLDIGCGTGNVTHDFLLPILPKSTNTVIGIDMFADAIKYAKKHYGQKIVFEQFDIVNDRVTNEEYFDHIFSFYCLPFISEQEIALRNIYCLLRPGGDFVLTCTVQCNFFEIGNIMSRTEEWKPYLVNYKNFLCPFQFSPNPKEELEKFLLKAGFRVLHLSIEPKEIMIPFSSFPAFMISHIPIKLPIEVGVASLDIIRKRNWNYINDDGEEFFRITYQMVFGHVIKPS